MLDQHEKQFAASAACQDKPSTKSDRPPPRATPPATAPCSGHLVLLHDKVPPMLCGCACHS